MTRKWWRDTFLFWITFGALGALLGFTDPRRYPMPNPNLKGGQHATVTQGSRDLPSRAGLDRQPVRVGRRVGVRPQTSAAQPQTEGATLSPVSAPAEGEVSDATETDGHRYTPLLADPRLLSQREAGQESRALASVSGMSASSSLPNAEVTIHSKVTVTFTRSDDWGMTRLWVACLQWAKVGSIDPVPNQTTCTPVQLAGMPRHVELVAPVPEMAGLQLFRQAGVAREFAIYEFDVTDGAWVLGTARKFTLTDGRIESK